MCSICLQGTLCHVPCKIGGTVEPLLVAEKPSILQVLESGLGEVVHVSSPMVSVAAVNS